MTIDEAKAIVQQQSILSEDGNLNLDYIRAVYFISGWEAAVEASAKIVHMNNVNKEETDAYEIFKLNQVEK